VNTEESTQPLIIVSNRGPAQFERDEHGNRKLTRGGGGLVTALSGLVANRDALWIASTMTGEDAVVTRENDSEPLDIEINDVSYKVLMVESEQEAFEGFYNVIANPILWFIQHYLWDLSNAPDNSTPGTTVIRRSTATSQTRWSNRSKTASARWSCSTIITCTPPRS